MDSNGNLGYDELDLSTYLAPLIAWHKLILLFAVLGFVVTFFYVRSLPRTYSARATIFVQPRSDAAGLLRDLPVRGSAGGTSSGYLASVLKSDTIFLSVNRKLHLDRNPDFVGKDSVTTARFLEKMRKSAEVIENRDGSITVKVRAHDPQLAADVANSMLRNLETLVVTASDKKADFINEKLASTTRQLDASENRLRAFLERHDVADIDDQAKTLIAQLGDLDGRLLDVDEELKAAESRLTTSGDLDALVDTEVRKRALESSRAYLVEQRSKLQDKMSDLPAISSEYARLQRDVTVLSRTFELLTEQYQLARITQKGEDGDYSVIDWARPNPRKVAPRVLTSSVIGGIVGFALASAFAVAHGMTLGRPGRRRKPRPHRPIESPAPGPTAKV